MEWVLILYFPLLAGGSILFCRRMNILASGFAIRKNLRSSSFVAGQRYFSTFFYVLLRRIVKDRLFHTLYTLYVSSCQLKKWHFLAFLSFFLIIFSSGSTPSSAKKNFQCSPNFKLTRRLTIFEKHGI